MINACNLILWEHDNNKDFINCYVYECHLKYRTKLLYGKRSYPTM